MKLVRPITHLTPPYQPHDPDHPDHSDHLSPQPPNNNPYPTPNKGSHFRCRTFLSKISIDISVVKPSQKWVTLIYVALFWAKVIFLYSCKGCVSQLDRNCIPQQRMGHTYLCRTFLSKISVWYGCEGCFCQNFYCEEGSHIFGDALFKQNFY